MKIVRDKMLLGLAIAAFVIAASAVSAARFAGWLERMELSVHDSLVALRSEPAASREVAVVHESEQDLQRFGHPLSDERLAGVIESLLAAGATVVAVDKYRDIPVAPGEAILTDTLRRHANVIWVSTFGEGSEGGIAPPAVLKGTDRAACGDVVSDADGRVRRALLYLEDSKQLCYALGFAVARVHLQAGGLSVRREQHGNEGVVAGNTIIPAITENSGPYTSADTAGYQMPLQYRRPAIPTFRLGDVVDGKVPVGAFKGRAVIIGSDAPSLRDFFDVPVRHELGDGRISGAMLHSQVASEIIDAARDPSTVLGLARPQRVYGLIIASSALVAIAVVMIDSFATGLMATLGVLLALLVGAVWSVKTGVAFSPLPPALAALVSCAVALGLRAWREKRQRNEMMGFFSLQVSPEVAEAMWKHRDEFYEKGRIPAKTVWVSVLFADIRNYSSITEKLTPQVMIDWLNNAIAAMTVAVQDNKGIVVRYVGDQVMALYGSPIPRRSREEFSRDAIAAVRSALDMGRRLDEVNVQNIATGLPAARVRVGIFSGDVIQGGLGSRKRFEFTTLGDTVNTASRLESYSTEDDGVTARILIGNVTLELCGDHFETQALGALQLKGKAQTVEVHRVLFEKHPKETRHEQGKSMAGPGGLVRDRSTPGARPDSRQGTGPEGRSAEIGAGQER